MFAAKTRPPRIALMSAVTVWFSAAMPAVAFTLPGARQQAVDSAVSAMIGCRYDDAFRIADSLSGADPRDGTGPMLRLFTIGLRDLDFEMTIDSADFERTYAAVISRTARSVSTGGATSYSLTLTGYAKATIASFHLRKNRYLGAVQTGLDALDLLRRAKQLDSLNTDPDYFLGLYEFARADLRKKLWWVLFWFPGNRERGIQRMEACSRSARFSPLAARLSLIDMYAQSGRMADARRQLDYMTGRFPDSRFVLWARARYFETAKQFGLAAEAYAGLAESYAGQPWGRYNRHITRLDEARMRESAGDRNAALELCRDVGASCVSLPRQQRDEVCGMCQRMQAGLEKQ